MLELNYRHSESRFNAAAHLLKKSCLRQAKRQAFENVLSFANITQLKTNGVSYVAADRASLLGTNFSASAMFSPSFKGAIFSPAATAGKEVFSNIAGPFNKS
jgi:hypothetical protein